MEYLSDEHYEQAEKIGVSRHTLYQRVYQYGWTIKKAISEPTRDQTKGLWPTWKEKAAPGVNSQLFYARRKLGWSDEEAATTPPLPRGVHRVPTLIAPYKHLIQKAKEHGVSQKRLYSRIVHFGWPEEEAVTTPPLSKGDTRKRGKRKVWNYETP